MLISSTQSPDKTALELALLSLACDGKTVYTVVERLDQPRGMDCYSGGRVGILGCRRWAVCHDGYEIFELQMAGDKVEVQDTTFCYMAGGGSGKNRKRV